MGIFKSFKDMGAMLTAAPDLFESANQLAENAKVQQAQAFAPVAVAAPSAEALVPIAGVTLEMYVAVSKGIAAYGYDAAQLPTVAAAHGIAPENWAQAQVGWAQRIQVDGSVGTRFNQLYTAA